VHRLERERPQDQQVERALEQVGSAVGHLVSPDVLPETGLSCDIRERRLLVIVGIGGGRTFGHSDGADVAPARRIAVIRRAGRISRAHAGFAAAIVK
jgi:hypothetical protein